MDIYFNNSLLQIDNVPFYQNEIYIKVDLLCQKTKNKLILFCQCPRTNIDCMIYCSEFNFSDAIKEDTDGQIISKMMVNYNQTNSNPNSISYHKIILKTVGSTLCGIIMYMPVHDKTFQRELLYQAFSRTTTECPICYERKHNCVAVHDHHEVCLDCVLRLEKRECPLCRTEII